jgi:lipid A 3-O-deacylase
MMSIQIKALALALGFAAICFAGAAQAQVEEFRIGVLVHDVNVTGNGAGGKEDGINLNVEVVMASPEFLSWAWSPKPFVNLSLNSEGLTNFGGAGLAWSHDFGDVIYGEIDFGLVIHDGITDLPPNPADPQRILLDSTRVILGSDVLFRTVFGLGVHMNENWDGAVVFEHLSHGQILASGRNEGLDNIGIRFSRKFGN